MFHTFVTTRLDDRALADVAAATLLALLLCALACALLLKLGRLPVRTLLPTAFLPNAGNLGLPISQLAFGDAGLSVAVAFFAVNSFVMHTIAVRLLPGVNTRGSWKSPILLASVLAVAMRLLNVPVPAADRDHPHAGRRDGAADAAEPGPRAGADPGQRPARWRQGGGDAPGDRRPRAWRSSGRSTWSRCWPVR